MQKYSSDINQSKSVDNTSQEHLINFYLNQKLRSLQDSQEQFKLQSDEHNSLIINEILKNNSPISIFGAKSQGKTTLALKIEEQLKESYQDQQVNPIYISFKSNNQTLWQSNLKQQYLENAANDKIRVVFIMDDFDFILLNNQEIMKIMDSNWKIKCKFIYFVNTSIIKHQLYQNWIESENIQHQYEIMQFDKIDMKNYFGQHLPWDECLTNINLSLNLNFNLIKSVVERIYNNYNIENILIKIIKLSSIVDSLEQEAGNAMIILKELKYIFKNQDFSFIRMKNSSFDFVSFHECNFEGSQMENVDISRCWFILCNINNVKWRNMVKNETQINVAVDKILESIIFTTDKKFAIVAFDNCSLELWHIKASKRIIFIKSQNECDHRDFSFDSSSKGNLLAVCIRGQKIKIQNYQSGKIIRKINYFHSFPIQFSHDNQILAFGNYSYILAQNRNTMIYLWNIQEGKEFYGFQSHTRLITKLQFSMDDKLLCFLSKSSFLFTIWNIKDQRVQHLKKIEGLKKWSISPDLRYLVSAKLCQIKIFDVNSDVEIRRSWSSLVAVTIFSSNGMLLACGLKNGGSTLFAFNQKKDEQLRKIKKIISKKENFGIHRVKDWIINKQSDFNYRNELISLNFSADESYLISGNRKGMIKFHDIQDNENKQLNSSKYFQVTFSCQGKKLAFSCLGNEKVFVINLEQRKLKYELGPEIQNKESLRSITFSFDDQLLACCSGRKITIWNLNQKELIAEVKNCAVVQRVVFSPVKFELASFCQNDSTIFIWSVEIQNYVAIKKQIKTNNIINQIAYSPCGSFLAQSGKYQLCLWNYKSVEIRKQFEVEQYGIIAIAFAPCGEILAAGGNFRIILWNVKQGNKIQIIEKHSSLLKFSPNGLFLASKNDSSIYIWNFSQSSKLTPLYAFQNDFALNPCNSSLKGSQIISDKGVNLVQFFLQMGGSI